MSEERSDNYRDYVIKDGEYIGRFDDMYRNSVEVPWHQDKTAYSLFTDLDLAILSHFSARRRWRRVLEVGCGYGYVTERLRTALGAEVVGIDVSPTAVERAAELFPESRFVVRDLRDPYDGDLGEFDLVMVKEVLWYVLDELDSFVDNLRKLTAKGGCVYVCQAIPDLDRFYGKEMFPEPNAVIDYLSDRFEMVYASSTYEVNSLRVEGEYGVDKYARFLGVRG